MVKRCIILPLVMQYILKVHGLPTPLLALFCIAFSSTTFSSECLPLGSASRLGVLERLPRRLPARLVDRLLFPSSSSSSLLSSSSSELLNFAGRCRCFGLRRNLILAGADCSGSSSLSESSSSSSSSESSESELMKKGKCQSKFVLSYLNTANKIAGKMLIGGI